MDRKRIKIVAEKFGIAHPTAIKNINISEIDVNSLDTLVNYKKRDSLINNLLNVIFKMMDETQNNETICFYILW